MNYTPAFGRVSSFNVMPDPGSKPAPDPDPGFAGMTTRGKPRGIKPK